MERLFIFFFFIISLSPIEAQESDKPVVETSTSFFEDGTLKSLEQAVNGKREGHSMYYFKSQIPREVRCYSEDLLNGYSLVFNTAGGIQSYTNHLNGSLHGWQIYFKRDNSIQQINYYIDGELVPRRKWESMGITSTYLDTIHYNGHWQRVTNPEEEYSFSGIKFYDSNNKGLACFFYPNGEVHSYQIENDDLKDGYCLWYHPNGELFSDGLYSNDLPIGTHRYFDRNSELNAFRAFELFESVCEFNITAELDTVYYSKNKLSYLEGKTPKESRAELRRFLLGNLKKELSQDDFEQLSGKAVYFNLYPYGELQFARFSDGSSLANNQELISLLSKLISKVPNWQPKKRNNASIFSEVVILF